MEVILLNPEWWRQHTRRAFIQILKLRAQRNLHHCSAIGGLKNRFLLIVLSSQTRRRPRSCARWKHWVRFLHARRYWRCWCYKTAHKGILWDDDLDWVFLEPTKLESGMAGLAHEAARQNQQVRYIGHPMQPGWDVTKQRAYWKISSPWWQPFGWLILRRHCQEWWCSQKRKASLQALQDRRWCPISQWYWARCALS